MLWSVVPPERHELTAVVDEPEHARGREYGAVNSTVSTATPGRSDMPRVVIAVKVQGWMSAGSTRNVRQERKDCLSQRVGLWPFPPLGQSPVRI